MPRILFFIISIFYSALIAGQDFPSQFWHSGTAILVTGDTLEGELKYDLENDLVQINAGGKLYTYSSRKLFFFEIFDVTVDNYRQFYVIPFEIRPNYKAPLMFEVVFEGKLTLLARESIVNQTSHYNSYYYTGGTYTRQALSYDFYFLDHKGEITLYTKKRKDLMVVMNRKAPQIKEFIKKNKLKTDEKRDLARIMAYYNALIGS